MKEPRKESIPESASRDASSGADRKLSISHRSRLSQSRFRRALIVSTVCLTLSAVAVVPGFLMGQSPGAGRWTLRMPDSDTSDMFLHFDQMKSFFNGIKSGEIYPRWEEDTNGGFGAPTTIFYPPGIYYVTSFFRLFSANWYLVLLMTQLAIMFASALSLYLYARRYLDFVGAIAAAALYIILPYRLIDQYHRQALAELLSFVWMPLILISLDSIFRSNQATESGLNEESSLSSARPADNNRRRRALGIAGLAASYGLFVWSHTPTAYQFSLILAIWIPLLAIFRKDFKGLIYAGLGIALGVGFSAAYLYPANAEKGLIHSVFIADNWPYHQSYVFMRTEYMLGRWHFFSLIEQTWTLNLAVILIGATIVILYRNAAARAGREVKHQTWILLIAGLVASFLMTRFSYPIGRRIPMIDIGVFSWRMLSITTLTAALLFGTAVDALRRLSGRRVATSFGKWVLLFVALSVAIYTGAKIIAPTYWWPAFVPETQHINYTMVPAATDFDADHVPDEPQVDLDEGNGIAAVERWDPERRLIHVDLQDEDTLWIRTFYYPGWKAAVDGRDAVVQSNEDGGMEIDVPSGVHEISLTFTDTHDRKLGRNATVLSVIMILLLAVFGITVRLIAARAGMGR